MGPVLGAVLTLALNSARITEGVVLLSAYSVGLAVPFLLAALGIGRVAELMRRYGKLVRYLSIATGVILVIIGVMLLTSYLAGLLCQTLLGVPLPSYVAGAVGGLAALPTWDLLKRIQPSKQA